MKKGFLQQKLALERIEFCVAQLQLCVSLNDDIVDQDVQFTEHEEHFQTLFTHIAHDIREIEELIFESAGCE